MRLSTSSILILAICCLNIASTLSAHAVGTTNTPKSLKKTNNHKIARAHKYKYGAYFVPPPPAYMPSILPELSMSNYHAPVSQTAESPYSKYIYARNGYGDNAPVATRSGVTTWSWGKNSL